VLRAGTRLRSLEVGVLAEVGQAAASVFLRPTVALLSTGNEIVPPEQKPGGGQIRNSNGPMLAAATREAGAVPRNLGIVRDDLNELTSAIRRGLAADAIVISGGVSAGVLDFVPAALSALNVREIFHHVNLKPGKPIWFGVLERESVKTLVFALPGNPVSSWVCFQLFVRPALLRLAGDSSPISKPVAARLTAAHVHRGDRPTYFPARAESTDAGIAIMPLPWQGSADLAAFARANALAIFEGTRRYDVADVVPAILLT
jgi:molybdopterin molybdotransferase